MNVTRTVLNKFMRPPVLHENKYFRSISQTCLKLKITEFPEVFIPNVDPGQWTVNRTFQPLKHLVRVRSTVTKRTLDGGLIHLLSTANMSNA